MKRKTLYYAINNPDSHVLFYGSKHLNKEIQYFLKALDVEYKTNLLIGYISLENRSRIYFLEAKNEQDHLEINLSGLRFNAVYVEDNVSDLEKDFCYRRQYPYNPTMK